MEQDRLLNKDELVKLLLWMKVEEIFKEQAQKAYTMGYNAAMKEMEKENELRRG